MFEDPDVAAEFGLFGFVGFFFLLGSGKWMRFVIVALPGLFSYLFLAEIHEKLVVVPADKASNNIVFVCKTHYINCLMEELFMSIMTGNPTYNLTAMSKGRILQNHHSVMLTFGISLPEEDIDLSKLYWIPKLHKNPYKKRYEDVRNELLISIWRLQISS